MSDQSRQNVFHLGEDDGEVGYFLTDEFPSSAGIYRYMPFRSFSHYRMHQLLSEHGTATCWFRVESGRREFEVIGFPKYGALEITSTRQHTTEQENPADGESVEE